MPTLSVPEPYQQGIRKILALPQDAIEDLAQALERVSATASTKEKVASVPDSVRSIVGDDTELIVRTIDSLHQVKAHLELSVERFTTELIDALRLHSAKEISAENVHTSLLRLFSIGSLAVSAKAQVLLRDHAYLYHDAKVLTDIRPVFGASTGEPPVGFVVDHTIKLVYHAGLGGHRELYIALDAADLAQLKKIIERAEEKELALRSLLLSKDIKVL